jgi:hypothetical protein
MVEKGGVKIEKSCPLTSAHTRLRQAHDLWHRAAASYAEPEEFVLNLNNTISTLRQVTFMLQNQKHLIEDFDSWYERGWRPRLKSDPVMSWLHDARTTIEHVGDLDLESTALVTVIASWVDGPWTEFAVPPHAGPEEIAEDFASADLPEEIRKEGLLRVERRWVAADLPGHELTDVCAHGYGVMAEILAEAHERLGVRMQTFGGETHGGRHERVAQSGGPLPCMGMTRESRTAHVHLARRCLVELESVEREVKMTGELDRMMRARFESMLLDPDTALGRGPDDHPFELAARFSDVARRALAHDGYHHPTVLFFDAENQPLGITRMSYEDQAGKYLSFRNLAAEAERCGASTVIHIGEAWQARIPIEELSPKMRRADERADRTETLCVTVTTADGGQRTYDTPFSRDEKGRPVVGETRIEEGSGAINPSFFPLMEMWERKRPAGDREDRGGG